MIEPLVDQADDDDVEESLPLRELERLAGGACTDCRRGYSAVDAVFSIVLGFKDAPRCLPCLSGRLGRDTGELRGHLIAHIHRRDCYLAAWREAERRDGGTPIRFDCEESEMPSPPSDSEHTPASEWNAGDMGCGELVMALRLRMNGLPAGAILKVTATDTAAPEDLPAWCRLSGHKLVAMQHPDYFIQRKGD